MYSFHICSASAVEGPGGGGGVLGVLGSFSVTDKVSDGGWLPPEHGGVSVSGGGLERVDGVVDSAWISGAEIFFAVSMEVINC